MLEAGIATVTAVVTGMAVLTQRVHNRITELDKRIDGIELKVAQHYVTKSELADIMQRFEAHMIRIEDKLDKIVIATPQC